MNKMPKKITRPPVKEVKKEFKKGKIKGKR